MSVFYTLGAMADALDRYYAHRGNKVISKHLLTFLSWMEGSGTTSKAASDIMDFLEKRYKILFTPGKIKVIRGTTATEADDGGDVLARETAVDGDFQWLKDCFIKTSYWRKAVMNQDISKGVTDRNPAISFFSGFDDRVQAIKDVSWTGLAETGWEKAVMATGHYYSIVMLAETLLLGNKGLQKMALSTVKQMNWNSLASVHEAITSTSLNIILRTLDLVKRGNKDVTTVINTILAARKTSAILLQEHMLSNKAPAIISPARIQFHFMAGALISGNHEKADATAFTAGKSFTPAASFMYCLGRVVYIAATIESSQFKSRSFLRMISLHRSTDPADWRVMFNNCMRVAMRKFGATTINLRKGSSGEEGRTSLAERCTAVQNREGLIRDSLGPLAAMQDAVIKGFLDMGRQASTPQRSYEVTTAFMMGFNYQQFITRKTSKEGDKKE
jgi:hypothetical protein